MQQLDLFDFAQSQPAKRPAQPPPGWDGAGVTVWGRAWLDQAIRLCQARYASELAFGEKLLQSGRLQSCRVRRAHAQATFTNREGGVALVNVSVRPLEPERWARINQVSERCGDTLFSSDDLPDDVTAALFGLPGGLLPERADLAFTCSHCHAPFCLYRAATLLAMTAEFDRAPVKLFELRGASGDALFLRAAQQDQGDADLLTEEELSELFGIEWAQANDGG